MLCTNYILYIDYHRDLTLANHANPNNLCMAYIQYNLFSLQEHIAALYMHVGLYKRYQVLLVLTFSIYRVDFLNSWPSLVKR